MSTAADTPSANTPAAGWYDDGDGIGLRFWDGGKWTEQRAPKTVEPLSQRAIASSVMVGVLAALFVIWLFAQIAPDTVYLPVKFVVKELPSINGRTGLWLRWWC